MTTILHVEDDESLASAVQTAFEAFGFPGRFVVATTVKKAVELLAGPDEHFDLVISDMALPDGSGFDVMRVVRSNLAHRHLPILILSGRDDARTVTRAYALGANCYVQKGGRGRTMAQVVRTLYDHWLQDARLPEATAPGRTREVIARATSIRGRTAQLYMRIAERLRSPDGDFWMGVAQREGNLANLLMFLLHQVGERELPADVLDDLEAHQKQALELLDDMEAKRPLLEDDGFRSLLALNVPTDVSAFVRAAACLFPAAPLAMGALCDGQAVSLDSMAKEIEARSADPVLRRGASRLRENAALLRAAAGH
jgi:DNA-binding response OmpR family regulator